MAGPLAKAQRLASPPCEGHERSLNIGPPTKGIPRVQEKLLLLSHILQGHMSRQDISRSACSYKVVGLSIVSARYSSEIGACVHFLERMRKVHRC
jgi:hypothetical protein